jgi:Ca-activated chloride channel family protein
VRQIKKRGSDKAQPPYAAKRKFRFHSGWVCPRIKALVATGIIFAVFFLLSGMFVVYTVAYKEEKHFCPPEPIPRPNVPLKKLQVPVQIKTEDKDARTLRERIVSKSDSEADSAEIRMPEVAGVGGSMVFYDYDSSSSVNGSTATVGEAAPVPSTAPVSRPKMKLKKPQVQVRKSAMPKPTTRIVTKVSKASMPDIRLPEMEDEGLGWMSGVGSKDQISIYGRAVELEEQPKIALDNGVDDLFGDSAAPSRWAGASSFNPYVLAADNAFSTFSIDVDTASYGLARQRLFDNALPEPELVRTEEFINSFDYDYRPPSGTQTFSVHKEMAPSPFRTGMDVLKIGIKGRRIGRDDHRGAVLTLVIDTSGSMSTRERIGLVKESLALLLDQLGPDDQIAIVQFGGEARLVKEHTPVSEKAALLAAINELQPGGPTQFDQGLQLGYELAKAGFSAGDSNRIIIMSDGVANLGELDPEEILKQVGENRQKGIYLSVLGFGAGTYDDDLLERLANRGDGMYAYIDTMDEARRVFVDQLASTLHVIASDVKIQVEFNPERVLSYRQVGYENRQLTKEQFRDDSVDAGEVGSGQSVTALYDIQLNPEGSERAPIATVYVRYRRADNGAIEEISSVIRDSVRSQRFEQAAPRFQLAACVAEFAEKLRRSPYSDGTGLLEIHGKLMPVALKMDLDRQIQELAELMLIAERLQQ